jgi:hypothetical protein
MPCGPNCTECYLNTQILLTSDLCEGIFVFEPDFYTCPAPYYNCSFCINVLKNCKGDYKLQLLDDNGCILDNLVLRKLQFRIIDVSEALIDISDTILPLYPTGYPKIIQIKACNLNLLSFYTTFEESAYFYRRVTQTYLNLWCGGERSGIICEILNNSRDVIKTLNNAYKASPSNIELKAQAQQIYALTNDFLKLRVVALKELCDCGKICNDEFFMGNVNPCEALNGCCPPY